MIDKYVITTGTHFILLSTTAVFKDLNNNFFHKFIFWSSFK